MQTCFYRTTATIACHSLLTLIMINIMACTQNNQSTEPERFISSEQAVINKIEALVETPVTLKIDTHRVVEPWSFLIGVPLTIDGNRIDYSQTRYAEDIKEGYFDDNFIALLQSANNGRDYQLIAFSLGATDAPFVDWPETHGAPRELIFPDK